VQLSTFNLDENFNDEDAGVWSNGRQDGECRLLVSQLPLYVLCSGFQCRQLGFWKYWFLQAIPCLEVSYCLRKPLALCSLGVCKMHLVLNAFSCDFLKPGKWPLLTFKVAVMSFGLTMVCLPEIEWKLLSHWHAGDDLVQLNLHDGYGNIKDEDERNCPNDRQNGEHIVIMSRLPSV